MLNRKKQKTETNAQEQTTSKEPTDNSETTIEEENEKPSIFDRFKKWFGEDIQ
jgi:hypothetical protein